MNMPGKARRYVSNPNVKAIVMRAVREHCVLRYAHCSQGDLIVGCMQVIHQTNYWR